MMQASAMERQPIVDKSRVEKAAFYLHNAYQGQCLFAVCLLDLLVLQFAALLAEQWRLNRSAVFAVCCGVLQACFAATASRPSGRSAVTGGGSG